MSNLSRALIRDVLDHHLPGYVYDPESRDNFQLLAEHVGGMLDYWLDGRDEFEDMTTQEFIAAVKEVTDFDIGKWLEAHRNEIDLD